MEKKHRCKFCYRSFANGRALGGHMRSHMMKFYAEEGKDLEQESGEIDHDFQFQSSSSPSPSPSSSEEESEGGLMSSYVLRDKRKKTAVEVDREFASAGVVQDGESETESSKMWRRSKRVRESRASDYDVFGEQSSPLSSISDTTPEEHVAHCLMMLSRDTWRQKIGGGYEGEESKKMATKGKIRGRFRCEECNKLFRSYQALGGHRASHKKIKSSAAAPPPPEKSGGVKIHQCPFCDRIFSSGQALGGHKRSHFIGAAAISTNRNSVEKNSSRISQVLSIDLNLPAPADDDEGSQIAISAVSDAEFVCNVKQ
ncbi:zinc finger protein ZAT4-like [Salvia divinorum]|uniref:Zinc finger protein ZAT4-like n=1 Tax=Salvia divinorum TaxID=28513 RepID=A0ABD1GGX3_SALDI